MADNPHLAPLEGVVSQRDQRAWFPQRYWVWIFALMLCGCQQSADSRASRAPLSGKWQASFHPSWSDRSGKAVRGTLDLRPAPLLGPACQHPEEIDCGSQVRGTAQIPFRPLLGHEVSTEVIAARMQDESILIQIGSCCDVGEITVIGRMKNGRIRGSWSEARMVGAHSGSVTIVRLQ